MDESVGRGRVLEYLREQDLAEETMVVYMGDNGFALGEHGFYDKRDAFEEMIQNIDIAPTMLDLAGRSVQVHGVWDKNGLYDLETDPHERHNLIRVPEYADRVERMRERLFRKLGEQGGLQIPVRPPRGTPYYDRKLRD